MNLGGNGLYAYLRDQYLQKLIPLSLNEVTQVYFNINGEAASAQSDRFSVILSKDSKLAEAIVRSAITAYPNPIAGNSINVHFVNQVKGTYHITLFNSAGQMVLDKIVQHNGGTALQSLQLEKKLPAGIFRLQVTGKDTKTTVSILNY